MLCKIAKVSKADKIKDEADILLITKLFFKSKQKAVVYIYTS